MCSEKFNIVLKVQLDLNILIIALIKKCSEDFVLNFRIREGPASQPQSTISCWKKPPTVNKKKL